MGRPPLKRTIARLPKAAFFKPAGVPARELEQIALGVDEVEALRLVDLEGLSQEEAAADLGVSRQTVGRILEQARRRVADALVNGKAVVIGGGAYAVADVRVCASCGHSWPVVEASGRIDLSQERGTTTADAAGTSIRPVATGVVRGGRGPADGARSAGGGAQPDESCPSCGSPAVRACLGGGRGRGGRGQKPAATDTAGPRRGRVESAPQDGRGGRGRGRSRSGSGPVTGTLRDR